MGWDPHLGKPPKREGTALTKPLSPHGLDLCISATLFTSFPGFLVLIVSFGTWQGMALLQLELGGQREGPGASLAAPSPLSGVSDLQKPAQGFNPLFHLCGENRGEVRNPTVAIRARGVIRVMAGAGKHQ